jgi:hypothetical protein
MDNQIKFSFKSCCAFGNLGILIVKEPIIPFRPNTPAHDDDNFHSTRLLYLTYEI